MERQHRRIWLATGLLLALWVPASATAAPEGDDLVEIPKLHEMRIKAAKAAIEDAGLTVGTVYEISWRKALDRWCKNWPVGTVISQAPMYGRKVPRGKRISLIVSAERDGLLPRRLPPPVPCERVVRAKPEAQPEPQPEPISPVPAERAGAGEPAQPAKGEPEPKPEPDPMPMPKPDPVPKPVDEPTKDDDAVVATGSPEAPRPAPKANPDIVPPLMGLNLAVAEQLCRDAKMTLYVERVAGHPVGRVLEQKPEAYEPRGPAGVVRVIVTAGGDFEAKLAPPPAVHVDEAQVPELLDRTEAQALRILRDLRLVGQAKPAKRGLPGRVSNQTPLPGERVPVGSLVTVFIGPARTAPRPDANAPAPTPTSIPAPRPVSPAGNTPMPKTASVAAGFTWQPVNGATAYVLEIEEQMASGSWMQSVRKPVRKTAAMVEVERMDTQVARALRWRVRAVVNGTQGNPSEWVVLR